MFPAQTRECIPTTPRALATKGGQMINKGRVAAVGTGGKLEARDG